MQIPSSLLFISVSCVIVYGDETSCQGRVDIQPTNVLEQQYVIRFNNEECGNGSRLNLSQSRVFCGDSGWGDEEATVVCRSEMNTVFGIGSYAKLIYCEVGFSHVNCKGNEEQLENCEVGNLTSHECCQLGVAHCLNGDETNCQDRVDIQPTNVLEQQYVVRFNNEECGNGSRLDYNQSRVFCEDSGWGDEEATVVCRSEINRTFGIGSYVHDANISEVGFSHVNCKGNEEQLENCEVGNLTSHECCRLGVAHCLNVPQVLVSRNKSYIFFQQLEISESEKADFCVIVWGPLSDPLHVLVETIDSGLAVADYDYRPLRETVTFAPTESFRSHQCLQIEVIDDSLVEFWERFSVTLSTNSSAVNLTRHEFNVFIEPNYGRCTEGSMTVSNDVDNGSLQLVEMCRSQGVWSSLCDNDWTPQDATVVCRELGYQDPDRVTYDTIKRVSTIAGTPTNISCEGNETTLRNCTSTEPPATSACQLLLVDCSPDITVGDPTDVTTSGGPDDKDNSASVSTGGVIAGVVVIILLALVSVAVVSAVAIVKCKQRPKPKITTTHNPAYDVVVREAGEITGEGTSTGAVSHTVHIQPNPVYNFHSTNTRTSEELQYDYVL